MAEIKYEIKETVGTLSENNKGWSKELNLISWNDREPKYDIRDWAPEHEKMGKGVTLSVEELKKLREILNEMQLQSWKNGEINSFRDVVKALFYNFDWKDCFDDEYLKEIQYYCLVMSRNYIENHFSDIKNYANVIEQRIDDSR